MFKFDDRTYFKKAFVVYKFSFITHNFVPYES